MKIANTFRKALLIAAAGTTLVTGLSAIEASAAGYGVYSNATTANFVYSDRLNLRKWPAAHSQKLSHVKVGYTVWVERCILKSGTDWCKIRKGWKTGWVNGSFIQKGPSTFASRHPWY
ncbi:MAG: hypothetical protein COC23_06735 [Hyphomicrobiales bacterium]|nr:MAG: hypothetical protein COC23_06735 [Hyphomicrobiales bacterium]